LLYDDRALLFTGRALSFSLSLFQNPNMEEPQKSFSPQMQIIHGALMAGVFFFLVVSEFLKYNSGPFLPQEKEMAQIFLIAAIVLAVSAIGGGMMFSRKRLESLRELSSTEEILGQYRSLLIIRAALMEGPAFFFIVGNLLFGSIPFLAGALVCLLVMAAFFPTRNRIERETGAVG